MEKRLTGCRGESHFLEGIIDLEHFSSAPGRLLQPFVPCTAHCHLPNGPRANSDPETRIYLIEQLQHDGEDIWVGFVNLVEEHHSIWTLPQLFGELPALFMAHVARRRADKLGDLGGSNRTRES